MKRVLIITYYWPPNGGAGVYRWLKFAKYLPAHGWKPVIYTPANPELTAFDPGLSKDVASDLEVIKRPITEPFSLYKRFTGRAQNEKIQTGFLNESGRSGWRDRLALWVRSNFFIPDARIWWVRPSIRFLRDHLHDQPVDAIITTGPPHSMHLIGRGLKRTLGFPWLADFRDPWTDIDFFGQLKLTRWADRAHHRMEQSVLREADQVVTVSSQWAKDLAGLGGRPVDVITNGYDPADLPTGERTTDDDWSLVHVGALSPTRDVPALWTRLAAMCSTDPEFARRLKLRFIGPVDRGVLDSVAHAGLAANLEPVRRVDHAEAMREMNRARVLLLPVNDTPNHLGILPGKLFEYLSVQRPILAVGPADGDIARVLGPGHLRVDRDVPPESAPMIRALFAHEGPVENADNNRFDRRVLAGQVAATLNGMIAARGVRS